MLGSVDDKSVIVADLEAGIGTLTRLDARTVDAAVVVTEPTAKSIEVGRRAVDVARDKEINLVVVVANRVRDTEDFEAIQNAFPDLDVIRVPNDEAISEAERRGVAPLDASPGSPAVRALAATAVRLLDSAPSAR